jgi:hypothetical protein
LADERRFEESPPRRRPALFLLRRGLGLGLGPTIGSVFRWVLVFQIDSDRASDLRERGRSLTVVEDTSKIVAFLDAKCEGAGLR